MRVLSAYVSFVLLGPLAARDAAGASLPLGGPKQRAVLARLLLDHPGVVSTRQLIATVWPDDPPPQAELTLQTYVSHLRRILGGGIDRVAPGYALRARPGAIDAVRFAELATAGREALGKGDPGRAGVLLREGLALWQGAALADLADREPFGAAAERLEQLRLGVREAAVEAELQLGHHAAVLDELQALVAEHPLHEPFRMQLMSALYAVGQQAEALRVFREGRSLLIDELGIEPGPALQRLEQAILRQDPALPGPGDARPPVGVPRPRERLLQGRDHELRLLRAALDDLVLGSGTVILVTGEAGIGKTSLVQALAEQAPGPAHWGQCSDEAGAPAYWPWIQIVRSVLRAPPPGPLPPAAMPILRLVPEAAGVLGGQPGVASGGGEADPDRFALHEAVTALLRAATAHAPTVVVLDDLQWADPASLELLAHLVPAVADLPVVLAVVLRAAAPVRPQLVATQAVLARAQRLLRLSLEGLDEQAVADVVRSLTGQRPDAGLAAEVRARTGGNPFFLTELASLAQHAPQLPGGLLVAVPQGVRDVLRRRLQLLPAGTRTALDMAAVLGERVDLGPLARALDVPADGVLDALGPAVEQDLLSVHGDELRFRHALVRDALLAELSADARARLHARVAAALAGAPNPEPAAVAFHWLRAAPAGHAVQAVHALIAAAGRAAQLVASEAAEAALREALGVLDLLPDGLERDRLELVVQTRLAAVLAVSHGYGAPGVGEASSRALLLCERVGPTPELLPALWGLGEFALVRGEPRAALAIAVRLQAEAARAGEPAFVAGADQAVGATHLHLGAFATALEHLRRGIARSDAVDSSVVLHLHQHPAVACRGFAALAQWHLGDEAEALATAAAAIRAADRLDHAFSRTFAHFFTAWLAVLRGDAETAAWHARQAGALAATHRFPVFVGASDVLGGWSQARQGELEVGTRLIREGREHLAASGTRMLESFFLSLHADVRAQVEGPAAGIAMVREALAIAAETGEALHAAALHVQHAELLRAAGAGDEAVLALEHATVVAAEQGSVAVLERARRWSAAVEASPQQGAGRD